MTIPREEQQCVKKNFKNKCDKIILINLEKPEDDPEYGT